MSLIKAGDQLAKHSLEKSCVWAQQMRIDESPFLPVWVTLTSPCLFICPKGIATMSHQYPTEYMQMG